jgi:hypothetical protein
MMIWLLALILLASLAGLGYRQGAIRVAFSLVAIFIGALLAVPVGSLVGRMLVVFGIWSERRGFEMAAGTADCVRGDFGGV